MSTTQDGTSKIIIGTEQNNDDHPKIISSSNKPKQDNALNNIKAKTRKGANGVLLKRFESVMCDMFSSPKAMSALTPRYSHLPPFMNDAEKQTLEENARKYWKQIGLTQNNASLDSAIIKSENDSTTTDGIIENNFNNEARKSTLHPSPWPFDNNTGLPALGSVRGDKGGVGDVTNHERAWRKEMQLSNMIQCILALLPNDYHHHTPRSHNEGVDANEKEEQQQPQRRKIRIVDFGGGTGHLTVPLALLLPHCEVVCVDLKKWSLDLLHKRVDGLIINNATNNNDNDLNKKHDYKLPCQSSTTQTSQTLPNLSTYHGSIQTYPDTFDIGVSLHACGEASDWTLRKCMDQTASWVVCGCCCGKLRREAGNPYVYQSTGGNEKEVTYPQSRLFACLGKCEEEVGDGGDDDDTCGNRDKRSDAITNNSQEQIIMTADMFDELAKAADYSELGDVRKPRNACRRAAKSLVEWDRLLYTKECMECNDQNGGNAVLTRMVPWEASPKNDILIGWFDPSCNPYRSHDSVPENPLCHDDFGVALKHLFGDKETVASQQKESTSSTNNTNIDQNDWTAQEEADIQSQLEQFLLLVTTSGKDNINLAENSNNNDIITTNNTTIDEKGVLRFPTRMGPRKRKLIHFVAERMKLRHWGEGKRDADKIVVVAQRRAAK